MIRVQVATTGWAGGPGVNTLYFVSTADDQSAADEAYARVHTLWTGLKGVYSKSVTIHLVTDVDDVNPINGEVRNTFAVTPTADFPGTGLTVGLAPPSLALLAQYKSADFTSGRRIAGRSFISPVSQNHLESDGTPSPEATATVVDNFNVLRVANNVALEWVIWQRPRKAGTLKGGTGAARDGRTAVVATVSSPNKFASLRSRRD